MILIFTTAWFLVYSIAKHGSISFSNWKRVDWLILFTSVSSMGLLGYFFISYVNKKLE